MPPPAPTFRQVVRRWVHLVIFLLMGMLIGLLIGFIMIHIEESHEVEMLPNLVSILKLIGDA